MLHALAGVLGDDEDANEMGELLIDGRPVHESRGRTGLMQQDPDAQVVLSRIGDDVAFGAENLAVPREEIWRRVPAALESVGLNLPLDHSSSALSGGQKQRLGLAGILAMRPGLLLLDEPTANLDPAGVVEVRDAVRRSLDETGATLVVVEHRVSVWLEVVDRIVVLAPAALGEPGGLPNQGTQAPPGGTGSRGAFSAGAGRACAECDRAQWIRKVNARADPGRTAGPSEWSLGCAGTLGARCRARAAEMAWTGFDQPDWHRLSGTRAPICCWYCPG